MPGTSGPTARHSRPRLGRRFFARSSPDVARALLGCWLVHRSDGTTRAVQICETEAYLGEADPASHARMGPTPRNLPMYGPPGFAYVYLIYGMHHCLNIVTGPSGRAEAVLLRGARPSPHLPDRRLDGPARLCAALGIDLSHNRLDLCRRSGAAVWLEAGEAVADEEILIGPRIGVADPAPLRFRLRQPPPGPPT